MSIVPTPPPELSFGADEQPTQVCARVADYAQREAEVLRRRRFFASVAVALGRTSSRASASAPERFEAAGAELARELARHARESWVRDGIDRGLSLYCTCVDETGRRCVAGLVAEYFGWREPPDLFFHRVGGLVAQRSAAELVGLARVTAGYARLPKPSADEQRLLAAIPQRASRSTHTRRLAILGFRGEPPREHLRSTTEIPSRGSEPLLLAFASADLGEHAEPEPPDVPLVGRPLLWFPASADHDLRRLHLLLAGAIA